VINSCLIGIGVGYFVSWMMGLQRELFSDLPVEIEVSGLSIIVIAAIISSILSTYKPLN
jgi:ABC-type lipoprotein release transport system permease subunit